jgi:hypothetical protein
VFKGLIIRNPGLLKELALWSRFQMVIPFAVAIFGIHKCKCVTDIIAIVRVLFFSTIAPYQESIICLSMLILCVLPLPLITWKFNLVQLFENISCTVSRHIHDLIPLFICLSENAIYSTSNASTFINHLAPNGHFSGHTAPLTYRCCISYLFNRYTYWIF